MKNTTFRKKALLSSVAMLLVALVALGSATFAWFAQNPTVTASGLTLNATTSAGLQIVANYEGVKEVAANQAAVFGTSTKLNVQTTLGTSDNVTIDQATSIDRSVTNAVTFRNVAAANELENDWNGKTADIAEGGYAYVEDIYLRSSVDNGEAVTVKQATVTLERATENAATKDLYEAIRVTLVDGSNIIGTWSIGAATNPYLTTTGPSTATYTTTNSGVAVPMDKDVTYVADSAYSSAASVKAYVWLDGEDESCFTQNVEHLSALVKNISISFSTTPLA